MKRSLFIVLLSVCAHASFCQMSQSQPAIDSVSNLVIHFLQEKQADSIYAMAGEEFKSKLSQSDFKSVAESQVFVFNDFKNTTFVSTTGGINKYKVTGTPELQLLVGLDEESKLYTLLIQPFTP